MTARKLALLGAVSLLGAGLAVSAFGQSQLGSPRPDAPLYKVPDFTAITQESPTEPDELREVVEHYVADERSLRGRGGPSFGRGGSGGGAGASLPYSEQENSRMRKFYTSWQEGLQKLNFDALNQNGKADYILLRDLISYELRQLDIERERFSEMEPLIPFATKVVDLYEDHQKAVPFDPTDIASRLTELHTEVQNLEAELKRESRNNSGRATTPGAVVNRAAGAVTQLRRAMADWNEFYSGYDPMFTWWASQPYKDLDASLESLTTTLRRDVLGLAAGDRDTIVGDPIGREALLVDLAREMIPYTPEEMIEIANKEFAWCEAEMIKASRELGFGDDWHKALEHVKTLHVPPGEQPALIRQLAYEAIEFLEKNDLITIPPQARNGWGVQMMTVERQRVNPFFTGGANISVSFPTDTMTHEQKLMSMRGNNIHFARATVFHELIPGHNMQRYMNSRYRTYRGPFSTPFWGEGWALYWELLLWDKDFHVSFPAPAENKIGALFWRMHRCARIIFSLSFHLGKMTAQESIDFLVDRVGHERENATAEVRRSFATSYSPLYQMAYLTGGMQFRALHRELVESGKMNERVFHDTIMHLNSMPVEMVRATLTSQPLTRDFKSQWRFYVEPSAR